jgi:hypothetical protein
VLTQLLAVGEQLISWQRTITDPIIEPHPFPNIENAKASDHDAPIIVASAAPQGDLLRRNEGIASTDNQWNDIVESFSNRFANYIHELKAIIISLSLWFNLHLVRFVGSVLGKSLAVSDELAGRPDVCISFFGTSDQCSARLTETTEYYGTIPDSILGCINLYVLPCLYGFLGSAIAAIKYVGRQIDGHLLSFTDRGRIIQNEILGLMAGSIVGLFATYLTTGNQTIATLSVSAIAFLAGYNIPALFRLFEDLSTRVLVPSSQSAK